MNNKIYRTLKMIFDKSDTTFRFRIAVILNIWKKIHVCYYSKPIISRYVSFSTRDIIYECKCGNRKVFREYRDFSDPFPIETGMIETQKEFEIYLTKTI